MTDKHILSFAEKHMTDKQLLRHTVDVDGVRYIGDKAKADPQLLKKVEAAIRRAECSTS